jgi:SAM-dependent methyltransferase
VGKDSKFFQENGVQVVSTDLSPEMVQLCREKGLEAYEMDFKNLRFPDENFDAIYALSCLLHVPKKDLPEILNILNKLLKPAGLLFMSVYGGPDTEGVWEDDYHQPKRFFSTYSDDQLLAVVTPIFELEDFKTILLPDEADSDLHAQRLILRKI